MIHFVLWSSNYDWIFDVEFLKLLMLTPKVLRPILNLFLKFGHTILVRVLMLNF